MKFFAGKKLVPRLLPIFVFTNSREYCRNKWHPVLNRVKSKKSHSSQATMKIDSKEFQLVITPEVRKLQKLFTQNGYEIRIAGGAVRDLLSGITPKDLDFATTATPEQMKDLFTKNEIRLINMKGESHGTITPRINDSNFEITTLRIDKLTNGRHAVVDFTTDWFLDASRRDLTINAMYLDFDGVVHDFFNGFEDLQKRRVVFVGNASQRIQEDYLRILRYFRFYGRIAEKPDNHEEEVISSITENKKGLEGISGERIWTELDKIISGNHGFELLKKIVSLNIGPYIGLPQKYNLEEFHAVSERLRENNFTLDSIAILCSLLNNAEDMEVLHLRLKLSGYQRDLGFFIIEHRNTEPKPLRYYQQQVVNSKNSMQTTNYINQLLRYQGYVDILKQFEPWKMPQFPLKGNKFTQKGIVDGLQRGFIITKLKLAWIESDFTLTEEEMENLIFEIASSYVPQKKINQTKKKKSWKLDDSEK